jgi:hypothetical protein
MTKKRLSDLLKEEVTKAESAAESAEGAAPSAEAGATPTPDPVAPAAARRAAPRPRTTSRGAAAKKTAKAAPAARAKAKPVPEAASAAPASPSPAGAETDPSQQVAALQKELTAAQKERSRLEKTIAGLHKDLETQQTRLFELKDSLAQAEAGTKAKDEALAKALAELAEAKQHPAAASQPRRTSGVDILPRPPVDAADTKARPAYRRGVPEYAIQTGQPNPMLSDADIGWVD